MRYSYSAGSEELRSLVSLLCREDGFHAVSLDSNRQDGLTQPLVAQYKRSYGAALEVTSTWSTLTATYRLAPSTSAWASEPASDLDATPNALDWDDPIINPPGWRTRTG